MNGRSSAEGTVEVCISGRWSTLCDEYDFGTEEAQVICNQLGFSNTGSMSLVLSGSNHHFPTCLPQGAEPFSGAHFREGTGPISTLAFECTGTEIDLQECDNYTHSISGCGHHEDVGVRCQQGDSM